MPAPSAVPGPVPAATAGTAGPCPHPGARRGRWGAGVGSPRLSRSHRPGTAGGTWWQRARRPRGKCPQNRGVLSAGAAGWHGSAGTAAASAVGTGARGGRCQPGCSVPGRWHRGALGAGEPPGRGGSAFPLIGAANGGRFPLRVPAGSTSCATARAAVLIKLPVRGDGARWPHGTGTVPPPCHPPQTLPKESLLHPGPPNPKTHPCPQNAAS